MDIGTKRKSLFVNVAFAVIILVILFSSRNASSDIPLWVGILLLMPYLPALTYGVLNTPYSNKLSDDFLIIGRRRSPLRIPLQEIKLVREFNTDDRNECIGGT